MRNPNGYGTVKKLSGKRRKPYGACITVGFEADEKTKTVKQKQKYIGYYATRKEAINALADYHKNPIDLSSRQPTFKETFEITKNSLFKGKSKTTISGYNAAFNKCESLFEMKLSKIKLSDLQAVCDIYSGKSRTLQKNIIAVMNAVFNYGLANEYIYRSYVSLIEKNPCSEEKKKTVFTPQEIELLWKKKEYLPIVMIYTGLRIGELSALTQEDIHEDYIEVHGTKTIAAERIVPLHKDIRPYIKDVLVSERYTERTRYNLAKEAFDLAMENCGLMHTSHECRHTFISVATVCKLNQVMLKKIAGHKTQDVTESVYTHVYVKALLEEIEKFNPMLDTLKGSSL